MSEPFFKKKLGFSIVLTPEFHLKEVISYFREIFDDANHVKIFSIVDLDDSSFFDAFDMTNELGKINIDNFVLKEEFIQGKIEGRDIDILSNLFEKGVSSIHKRELTTITEDIFPNGICLPGLQKIFVDTHGGFHLCEKISWNFSIGSIDKGFDNEKIFYLINKYIESAEECRDCWAVRFCEECFLSSIKGNTFSKDLKKKNCCKKREKIQENMIDYIKIMEGNPRAFDYLKNIKPEEVPIASEVFKFLRSI